MKLDISLFNQFLMALAESSRFTPTTYLSQAMARMQVYGFSLDKLPTKELASDYGDIYLLLDQWADILEPNVNQLEKKLGEKIYLNLVWADNGAEIAAQVVPESQIEDDEYGDVYTGAELATDQS